MRRSYLISVGVVFFLAFSIRVIGAFAYFIHVDEPLLVGPALRIVRTGDMNPVYLWYPTFTVYFQSFAYFLLFAAGKAAGIFQAFSDVPLRTLVVWGRLWSVVFSMGTIYITFRVAYDYFGRNVAFLTAVFLSFSFLHVENSYLISTDIPMTFWVLCSLWAALINQAKGPRVKYYVYQGLMAGLAIGSKYTAVWIILPLVFVSLSHASFRWRGLFHRRLCWGLFFVLLGFFAVTPYALKDFPFFLKQLFYQHINYTDGYFGQDRRLFSYAFYLQAFIQKYGLVPMILAGLGIFALWRDAPRKAGLWLCYPLAHYLFVGSYPVAFDRNMVVMIPFLSLLSAQGFFFLWEFMSGVIPGRRKYVRILLTAPVLFSCALAAGEQAVFSFRGTYELTLADTRFLSNEWIEAHIPHGARIGRERYTFPLDSRHYDVRDLGYFGALREENLGTLDYLIVSSYDYGRFFAHKDQYPREVQRYRDLFKAFPLVKEFTPDFQHSRGPVIRIFKIMSARTP